MPNSKAIEFSNVSFSYGDRGILTNLNLNIPKGKVVAIMGGSGCGKTTILRLMGGQIQAAQGSVKVEGEEISKLNKSELFTIRKKIGMLFQSGALFTDLSVYENIAFPLREHTDLPDSIIDILVLMKLQAVGLRGASSLMPSELSGGMARRVALARAIALDPQLILYDEPFAGLDPISLSIVGQLIRKLNMALGATSIVVTHDVQESLKIVDYVYFISDGAVIAEGHSEDIKTSQHPFVQQFVYGQTDGPVPFHYEAADYFETLMGRAR